MTTLTEDTVLAPEHQLHEPGDSEKFSHYADKDKIMESALTGNPVVALCGKVWVPTRDPSRFPVCPACKDLFEMGPEGRQRFFQERSEG